MKGVILLAILSVVAYASASRISHGCDTVFTGCTIKLGRCRCGEEKGCHNPFPYSDKHQCRKDLKGDYDKCKNNPCAHGQCVQITQEHRRHWHCSCAGSGFYGKRCQHECPSMNQDGLPHDYPVDCIF